MIINNTLVFKTKSVDDAIKSTITTIYKPEVAEEIIAVLKFEDGIGKCTQEGELISQRNDKWMHTTYFIPTIINSTLIKVEVCSEGEWVKNEQD